MMERKGAASFERRFDMRPWRVLVAVYLALCGSLARADDGSIFARIWGMQTDVSMGAGAGVDQRYMGGRDFRPLLLPVFDISRGIFFLDSMRGAGVQYLSPSGFYAAEALNYDLGRADSDSLSRPGSDHLRGMGNVPGTLTDVITLSQQVAWWLSLNAQAEFGLAHERGNQYQLGMESVPVHTPTDSLTLDLDLKIGTKQYNRTYFGVTHAQSASSGFTPYAPGSGIYGYSLSATWNHNFDKHWSTQLVLSATRYTHDAADSPVVQQSSGITVFPSFIYRF
jgi:outer membrane protein